MDDIKDSLMSNLGKRLKEFMKKYGMTPKELARLLGISYSHFKNILYGRRNLNLELAHQIAEILGVPVSEIASMVVADDIVNVDKTGNRYIPYIKLYFDRGTNAGLLTEIKEKDLQSLYPDYEFEKMHLFVKRYMEDVIYKDSYEQYRKIKETNTVIDNVVSGQNSENLLLRDIVAMLSEQDEKTLQYLKQSIELYIKNHMQ